MKIDKKITGYKVVEETQAKSMPLLERSEKLEGKTYKIKPVNVDHAYYITINNENGKPYEIFINSKNTNSFEWVALITRLISALMRSGQPIDFIIEEMKVIHTPEGGYFVKGHGYVTSIVAEIGLILEKHIKGE